MQAARDGTEAMTRPDFQDTDGEQGFVAPATVTLANGDRVEAYERDFRARKAAAEAVGREAA